MAQVLGKASDFQFDEDVPKTGKVLGKASDFQFDEDTPSTPQPQQESYGQHQITPSPNAGGFERAVVNVGNWADRMNRAISPANVVRSIPETIGNTVGGVYNMARHPVDTAVGLARTGAGVVESAIPFHNTLGLNANIPYAKAAGEALVEPYRSPEAFGKNPTQALLNLGLLATGGGEALGLTGKAAQAAGAVKTGAALARTGNRLAEVAGKTSALPFTLPVKAAASAIEKIPESVQRSLYNSAFKFPGSKKWVRLPKGADKTEVIKAVDAGIKAGVYPTEAGQMAARTLKEQAGAKLDAIVSPMDVVSRNEALDAARKAAYKTAAFKDDPAAAMQMVDEMVNTIERGHNENMTANIAHQMKIDKAHGVAWDGTWQSSLRDVFDKALSQDLNRQLRQIYPEYKKANEEYNAYSKLEEGTAAAANRIAKHNPLSLGGIGVGGATGVALHSVPAAVAGVGGYKLLTNPNVVTGGAIALDRARRAAGNVSRAMDRIVGVSPSPQVYQSYTVNPNAIVPLPGSMSYKPRR